MVTTATRHSSHFFTETLPNGLQLLGQQVPGVQSAAAVFWVCTGTRDEPIAQMGVSHFLEHMAFKGNARLPGDQIDRAFEELGADHNAATSWEMTFYWARVLSENVSNAIDVLAELTRPVLREADFNQERQVILEEIARYEDQPTHILYNRFVADFFGDHPLARETLGTPDTLMALTPDQMREYWSERYGTHNMLFAIAGNFDWDAVRQQVESLSTDWKAGETGRELCAPEFLPGFTVHQREQFAQEQIAIGVPSIGRKDPRYYVSAVLATILGDDTGSRLFWALYQPGLAETASAHLMEFEETGSMLLHIATEPSMAQRALEVALHELERLQRFDVEQSELERAKAKLNSSVVIGGESTNERVMSLISSWLTRGELESLDEIRRKIDAVTLQDLRDLITEFPVSPHYVITCVGPLAPDELQRPS